MERYLRDYVDEFACKIGFQSFNDMSLATLVYGAIFSAVRLLIYTEVPKFEEGLKRRDISAEIVKLVDANKDANISIDELKKLEGASHQVSIEYSIKSSSLTDSLKELPLSDLEKLLNHLNLQ